MLITPSESFLLVVDVQEGLAPAISHVDVVIHNVTRLIKAARKLHVPVLFTEHCPDRIGPSVQALSELITQDEVVKKKHFSACSEPLVRQRFADLNRKQVLVTGTETHVCVLQTALALKLHGYSPYLVADATSTRHADDKEFAIERLRSHDIDVVTTEMVIFEWLERGDTQVFRELLPLIK